MNYDNALAVTREIYWVGFYDEESSLHCNPYLLINDDGDVVLFDPGSIPHFPIVMRKIVDTVNPKEISHIIVSHQDPDVCGNLAVVEDIIDNPDLKIAAHTNSIRLLRHYGLKTDFYAVDEHEFQLTLQNGRVLDFLFTPYLHSPGAIVTYDRQSKSLFSADIFGAVSIKWSLFGKGDILDHITVFHQIYMPGREILRNCMNQLEKLQIERILPQHGSIIEGGLIHKAIEHLKGLPCGLDLIKEG